MTPPDLFSQEIDDVLAAAVTEAEVGPTNDVDTHTFLVLDPITNTLVQVAFPVQDPNFLGFTTSSTSPPKPSLTPEMKERLTAITGQTEPRQVPDPMGASPILQTQMDRRLGAEGAEAAPAVSFRAGASPTISMMVSQAKQALPPPPPAPGTENWAASPGAKAWHARGRSRTISISTKRRHELDATDDDSSAKRGSGDNVGSVLSPQPRQPLPQGGDSVDNGSNNNNNDHNNGNNNNGKKTPRKTNKPSPKTGNSNGKNKGNKNNNNNNNNNNDKNRPPKKHGNGGR